MTLDFDSHALKPLQPEDLRHITGGMFPFKVAKRIMNSSTKTGMSAVDEQPWYKERMRAEAQAKMDKAIADMKATHPNWNEIINPNPFAPRPMDESLHKAAQPYHPHARKGI